MRILLKLTTITGFLFISLSANADVLKGKELHNSNCTSCHISMQGGDGSSIYTRENSRINSHPALIKQVKRCRDSLGVQWPESQVADVVEYLNTSFYKFKN